MSNKVKFQIMSIPVGIVSLQDAGAGAIVSIVGKLALKLNFTYEYTHAKTFLSPYPIAGAGAVGSIVGGVAGVAALVYPVDVYPSRCKRNHYQV